MNGSRSTPPRIDFRAADRPDNRTGGRSSLEALNRTIEGLEARIEGLMAPAARDAKPVAERPPASRNDAISEILQRQRALSASRLERAAERHIQTRAPSAAPEPRRQPERIVMPAYDDRQPARRPAEEPRRPPAPAQAAAPVPGMSDAAMREIADALVGLRQELKRDIEQGLSREMSSLRAEMHGITAVASQGDALAQDIRGDLQRLSDSIGQLGRQSATADSAALRAEFDDLRAMIDGLAREDSMHRMESRWTGVEDRLNVFDNNRDDELVALAYRLDEIKSQLGTMNTGPALYALEDKLVAVAQAIELIGRHIQPDDRRFEAQFSDLDARLDEISRAIVASGRTASHSDSPGVTRVEGRLADLSRQIDTLAYPADTGIAARIETLSARVEDLANAEAAARLEERLDHLSAMMERAQRAAAQPDLTGPLADISAKIDALDHGAVSDTLARRFDDLARRIDHLDIPPPIADDRFSRLEGQLTNIAHRLDETHAAPYDDGEVLRSLQDQIANLSSLISQPREPAPAVSPEVEGRMNALEDYLASSDEYIIEAARQAAEAVMEAYSRNGLTQSGTPAIGDIAAISALAGDLKTLEELSRSSEERTARTFEALHETLVHIADKLERIEERGASALAPVEEPHPFGRRDTAPVMPKAEAPVFPDSRDDPFEQEAVGNSYDSLKRHMHATVAMPSGPVDDDRGNDTVHAETSQPGSPSKGGLLSGLTRRLSARRSKSAKVTQARSVEPAPLADTPETMAPEAANQLLEPGSGTPDVKKILERVRAGQSPRAGHAGETDKTDFIAAARRAAQQAAQEVDTANRASVRTGKPAGATGTIGRHRRPILLAVGAVLLAILSYPLVSTLLTREQEADPAAIEMQAPSKTVPAMPEPQPAPTAGPDDGAVAPPDTPQPQADMPAAGAPEPRPEIPAGFAAPVADENGLSELLSDEPQNGGAVAEDTRKQAPAVQAAPAPAAEPPAAKAAALIDVPAEITPTALADAARGGDPMAFFEIGALYTEGRGVKVDLAKAAQWYRRAANAGVVPALYRLGSLYEKGTGVARDPATAKALYQLAAESGNANAMHNLAVMLASGAGATPDFALASMWFAKAADLGVRDSQFNLAILYARGNGVAKDLEESYKWFSVAANDGDADASQKRDQVAQELSADQLVSAKAKFAAWKPVTPDAKANDTTVPDSWIGKGTKTSSVDMKKAVRNIQAILNNNGFDAGTPDGDLGAKTVSAIKAFQTSIGQAPTGRITDALVKELLKRNG